MKNYQRCQPKILVLGDLMIDHYLWGKTERISPEAPVPVIDVREESEVLGGAGNVVNNLVTLGGRVEVASVIGADGNGKRLKEMLEALGVGSEALIEEPGRSTTRKSRVIASHQQVVRFDSETRQPISRESEEELLERIEALLDEGIDTILISDYGKGVVTEGLTQGTIALAKQRGMRVMVDPKGKDYSKYRGATAITPNRKEASEATGIAIADEASLREAGFRLKEELELERAIITLSEEGMAIFGEEMQIIPTVAKEVYDVTGAGDTVIATLGFVRACGGSIDEAARIANAAAAVVVGKLGSATASWEEIIAYEKSLHESGTEDRILDREALARRVERLRREGKRIVFTNGCFDILHLGHVKYLQKAASFGDVLIVGLNSDDSVRRLKGPERPVNPQYDRAYLLAALEAVDYVTIFDEDTPYELIRTVRPDVLVKGGDYAGREVVGSDIAGELRLVEFVEGRSTTATIEKMRKEAQ
ncbi:D-glycero-beta-D-manno-heptose-7-phosphate kinase [Nitratifractor salsuginis]|uniref:Bifunctional protein HldE n=1 Tax=Nitratifractor salsuginis (strain DSM 16511 / JCM 12458 / E9I37-1) TaxID=749222 RepID=E6WZN4_NITSE|nr:D-glycero-beta-D-manno-heptose-7-phosphate kinase [Nitratifractor salsuginis]ADV46675.1 D-alpha,beta-D-heptose 7-phosphate 1-kinase; D-beta-D-heptose 1-phosphate adenylyltransferase [Nitratifractor salsuginis DSM 16511]